LAATSAVTRAAGTGSGVAFFLLTFLGATEVRSKKSERLPGGARLDRSKNDTKRATEERNKESPRKGLLRPTREEKPSPHMRRLSGEILFRRLPLHTQKA
jgi:hypothetical protein